MKKFLMYLSILFLLLTGTGCETLDEKESKADRMKQESQALLAEYMKTQNSTMGKTEEQVAENKNEIQTSSITSETKPEAPTVSTDQEKKKEAKSNEATSKKTNSTPKADQTKKTEEKKTSPAPTKGEKTAKKPKQEGQKTKNQAPTNNAPKQNENAKKENNGQAPPKSEYNTTPPAGVKYIGNSNTGKFHIATCSSVRDMNPEHLVEFNSIEEAINAGYQPCKRCKPKY